MIALADGGDAPAALPPCCKHRRCTLRDKEAGNACIKQPSLLPAPPSPTKHYRNTPAHLNLFSWGPWPLGGSKTPSGQLLGRRKKPPSLANAMLSAGERPFGGTFCGRLDKKCGVSGTRPAVLTFPLSLARNQNLHNPLGRRPIPLYRYPPGPSLPVQDRLRRRQDLVLLIAQATLRAEPSIILTTSYHRGIFFIP